MIRIKVIMYTYHQDARNEVKLGGAKTTSKALFALSLLCVVFRGATTLQEGIDVLLE